MMNAAVFREAAQPAATRSRPSRRRGFEPIPRKYLTGFRVASARPHTLCGKRHLPALYGQLYKPFAIDPRDTSIAAAFGARRRFQRLEKSRDIHLRWRRTLLPSTSFPIVISSRRFTGLPSASGRRRRVWSPCSQSSTHGGYTSLKAILRSSRTAPRRSTCPSTQPMDGLRPLAQRARIRLSSVASKPVTSRWRRSDCCRLISRRTIIDSFSMWRGIRANGKSSTLSRRFVRSRQWHLRFASCRVVSQCESMRQRRPLRRLTWRRMPRPAARHRQRVRSSRRSWSRSTLSITKCNSP